MTDQPQVTIVMPAYNPGRHIADAIDSVRKQTLQDWVLLLVDDGSTEQISVIADSRLRILRQEHHGISAARNRALLEAKTEYIAFLDADDLWSEHKLEKQIAFMNAHPETALSFTQFERIDENGVFIGSGSFQTQCQYEDLLKASFIQTSTALMRRSILPAVGLFDVMLPVGEDWDFFLRVAMHYKLSGLTEYLSKYREHAASTSRKMSVNEPHAEVYRRHGEYARNQNWTERAGLCKRAAASALAWHHIGLARCSWRRGDLTQSIREYLRALQIDRRAAFSSANAWLSRRLRRDVVDPKTDSTPP